MSYETPKLDDGIENEEPLLGVQKENETPSRDDMRDFLAEYAATTLPKPDESRLMKDAIMDGIEKSKTLKVWEKTVQRSKEAAREMMQRVVALENAFQGDTRSLDATLRMEVGNNEDALRVSVIKGEMNYAALNELKNILADCGEIRIPGRFYGADVVCIRFAGLLGGSDVKQSFSPMSWKG